MSQWKNKTILFLPVVLGLSSCEEQESIIEKYENGNPKKTRVANKLIFYEKNYSENGDLRSEGSIYENEKREGGIYYHENGKVASYANYREGKPFQELKEFYETGALKVKGEYDVDGYKTGNWIYYSEEESIKEKGTYYKGQKSGDWKYYNEEGRIELEEFYNEYGDMELQLIKDETGSLKKRIEFYKRNEIKSEKEKIGADKFHVVLFYENGQKKEEGNMVGEYEVGLWRFWDKFGNKIAEGKFDKRAGVLNADLINGNIEISKRDARKLKKLYASRKAKGVKFGPWKYLGKKKKKYKEVRYSVKNDTTLFVKVY